jgi:16S rRNA (guanine(966)-N(2))-methyltransferase RsmD
LRVISGNKKGQRLLSLRRRKIRPTSDKVKGAIFNIRGGVEGEKVLDLFAGSGALGIEALSRGAGEVVFVDDSLASVNLIRRNLGKLGFEDKGKVIKKDVLGFLGSKNEPFSGGFDLILADPPYGKGVCQVILERLSGKKILNPEGIVVIEHHKKERIEEGKKLVLLKRRRYGDTLVSFFREKSKNKELL